MRYLTRVIFACVLISYSYAYGNERIYSVEEVQDDVTKYLKKVFNINSPSSLKDYYYFEGVHAGGEFELASELRECEKIYNDPNSKECDKFVERRRKSPGKVPSLFYRDLSQLYPVNPDSIKIENIYKVDATSGKQAHYIVNASAKLKSSSIILIVRHSYYKKSKNDLINDGFVSLLKINEDSLVDIHNKLENLTE